ncbi:PREDICTED: zinc finger MYND domain-containing protein 12-like [Branchiostoma belcheri]|uniref:Zinc finger MYND domain-containing protein 12-like n=1 Tax=Branchiostoma belcheri TaxID=7741 RepID=A0A6P4ZAL6_BRABE|nr:PREDICTED: zinc finger MYND domain-containing protein 12-like [Branchiostoma belcheri]
MTLNPLANPKGVSLLCELCQKPAFIQCTKCRVTYYCGVEHQKADWVGIHEKICQMLIPLRVPEPFLSSDDERQHRHQQMTHRKKRMIELTRTTGQKLLFEGHHEQAVPAAMQSLRFSIDVYGLSSIELVPSYLILGEASIGLGRLQQAEEYLAQAEWTVLKTPECSSAIKSKLYRNLGLLFAAKGNYDEARHQLANDIYYASEEFGPHDIHTAGGYFHMANVFFRMNRMDVADSLYAEVTNIWHQHLSQLIRWRLKTPVTPSGIGPAVEGEQEEEGGLDEAQEAEAIQVLNSIHDMREQLAHQNPLGLANVCHTLTMLYYLLNDMDKAREFSRKALLSSETAPPGEDGSLTTISELAKVLDVHPETAATS